MSGFLQKARYVDVPSIVVIAIALAVPLLAMLL